MQTLEEIDQKIAAMSEKNAQQPEQPKQQYEPFRPILDRVMVKRIQEDNSETKGGIAIPDKYRQQSNKGEVVAVGDFVTMGAAVFHMPIKPGDIVLFGEYNCEPFSKDGEEFLLVRVQDIRGVERLLVEQPQITAEQMEHIPAMGRA